MEPLPGFNIWKTERSGSDKGGGGLALLYKETLPAHQWTPAVPDNLQYIANERQWLIIDNQTERFAFLHVYIACQTTRSDSYLQWNEDLFDLVKTESIKLRREGFAVLAMGDFNSRVGQLHGLEGNTPDVNRNTPMFLSFVAEVNMIIINTLPLSKDVFTRFMDNSGRPGTRSLLDYGLIDGDHSNSVTTFIIDEEARYAMGSDHALLECEVEFGVRPKVKWSFHDPIHYNIHDKTDFSEYHSTLDTLASTIRLENFSSLTVEQMLPHVTETITQSAVKSFGLKVKTKKHGIKLPQKIIKLIQTKNALARQHHSAVKNLHPVEADKLLLEVQALKDQVKESISEVKFGRRQRLRTKLLKADPTRRKFWRFLQQQIKTAGTITALTDKNGKMVFEQHEVEDVVLHHFGFIFEGTRHPVHDPPPLLNQEEICISELELILGQTLPTTNPAQFEEEVCPPYTFLELNQMLQKLPRGKSSGYDRLSNELLMNTSLKFRHYILIFLNKILQDGKVPKDLNIGKCMLIYKVTKYKNNNLFHSHFTY